MSIPSFAGLLLALAGSDRGDLAQPLPAPPVEKTAPSSLGWRPAGSRKPAPTQAVGEPSSPERKLADSTKWRDVVVVESADGPAFAPKDVETEGRRPRFFSQSPPQPLEAARQSQEQFEELPPRRAARAAVALAAHDVDETLKPTPAQTPAPEPTGSGTWHARRTASTAAPALQQDAEPPARIPAPAARPPLVSNEVNAPPAGPGTAADPPRRAPTGPESRTASPPKGPPPSPVAKAPVVNGDQHSPDKPNASSDPFPRGTAGAENPAAAAPTQTLPNPLPRAAPRSASAPAPTKSGSPGDPFPRSTTAQEPNSTAKPAQPTPVPPQEEYSAHAPPHGTIDPRSATLAEPGPETTPLVRALSPAVEEWTNWTGGERSFLVWRSQPPGRTVATGPSSISTSDFDYPAQFGQEIFLGRRFDTASGFEGAGFFAENSSRGASLNQPGGVSLPFVGPHAGDFQQLDAVRVHASSNFWSASASWLEYWSGGADGAIRGRLLFGPRFLGITERFGFEADKAGATGAYAVKAENAIFAGEVGLGGTWNVTPELKLDLLGKYAAGGNVYNVEQQLVSPGGGFAYNNATRVSRFATIAELNAEADWRVRRGCHLIFGYRLWRIDQVARATSQLSFDSNDVQPSASTNGSLLAQGVFLGARFFWGAAVDPSCRSGNCRPYIVNLD